jgi:hypothetical protein
MLAVWDMVYGKSEQPCSENPNGPVCGKSGHVERKSSSERKVSKKGDDERAHSQTRFPNGRPVLKPISKKITSKADDENAKSPLTTYSHPEEELRDIYRMKALLVTALRAFRRYLQHQGEITVDLAGCVPIALWSLSKVPKFLPAGTVQRVLDDCKDDTPDGKQNYEPG